MAQMSSNRCDICTECEGIALCYECQQYLCASCRAWHDKFSLSKLHTVVDSSQVNKLFSFTKLLCEKHNRNFIHYCQKCSCLTCAICATSDHKAHPFTNVCEVSSQARTGVEEHIVKLKAKVKQLTELSDTIRSRHLKQAEEDKQKFTNEVKEISEEYSNIISLVADIFITRATDNFVLRQQYFRYFLDKTDKLSDIYQLVCTKLEHALTETHEVAFYIQYKELNKEYEELDKIPQLGEAEAIGELNKKEFTASVVDKIEEKYELLSSVSLIKAKDKEIQNLTNKLNNEREKANSLLESKDREIKKLLQDIQTFFKNSPVSLEKPENREIQVFVNIIMASKRLVFVFHADDKIKKVIQLIANKEGIPADQQILLLSGTGKRLRDEYTITDYGINNGSSLDLRGLIQPKTTADS